MSDIILNGVSIAELKQTKALIQKDAATFIANGIQEATDIIKGIIEAGEDGERTKLNDDAAKAVEILENVKVVSGVSDVAYYLPYYEEWGYADERPYTAQLDDAGLVSYSINDSLADLHGTLEDMEYTSKNWHSSQC